MPEDNIPGSLSAAISNTARSDFDQALRKGFWRGRAISSTRQTTAPAIQYHQSNPSQSETSEPAIAARPSQKNGINPGMWTLVSAWVG